MCRRWGDVVNATMSQTVESLRAFERLEAQIRALAVEGVAPPRVDVVRAATLVLGTASRLGPYRTQLADVAPGFDLAAFDELADSAQAVLHAHWSTFDEDEQDTDLRSLIDEGLALFKVIGEAGRALGRAGLLSDVKVKTLRAGKSKLKRIAGLKGLALLFNANWAALRNNIWITEAQLARAIGIAEATLPALGQADAGRPATRLTPSKIRAGAFALMEQHLDSVRRGLTFVRWQHNDVDQIAPTLYARRARQKPRAEGAPIAAVPSAGSGPEPIAADESPTPGSKAKSKAA